MQIIIDYESSWRNSFLDGSNNEELPKKGRNYIASTTALKTKGNYKERSITKNTVMGILNRLIGDQRKLYQARQDENYYFKEIESVLTDSDIEDQIRFTEQELVFLRNMSGNTDQNSFSGMIQDDHITFNSDYSQEFWGILWLNLDDLQVFIANSSQPVFFNSKQELSALRVLERINYISGEKNLKENEQLVLTAELLKNKYPNEKKPQDDYVEKNGTFKLIRFYAAALYMQLERLSEKYDMSTAANKRGANTFIYGFSKRDFNGTRDFMKNFITGKEKLVWGNPYMLKTRVKGEGEVTQLLTKASGKLTINLDISREEAKDLEEKINNAGVSAFYLGKKGLAYVSDIRI